MLRPGDDAPPPAAGAIALLPLAAAADPPDLATRTQALLAAGWDAVGLDGLEAALLPLIDPAALPGDGPVLLRWSPGLTEGAAMQALRGHADPTRLVLTGCTGAEALGWGLDIGLRRFAGPAVEALIAAAREAEA